jgi:hypothetical protein
MERIPFADVSILQDAGRLAAIIKDGRFHKPPSRARAQRRPEAA